MNPAPETEPPHCLGSPLAVAGTVIARAGAMLELDCEDVDGVGSITGDLAVDFAFEPNPRLTWNFRTSGDALATSQLDVNPGDLVWLPLEANRKLPLRIVTLAISSGRHATGTKLGGIVDLQSLPEPSTDLVQEVRFDVINLNAPYGTVVVTDDSKLRPARHEWDCGGWRICLDGQPGVDWSQLSATAGYGVTHAGRLTRTDGSSFDFADVAAFLECLHWFLSLVQGRRVGIALPRGFADASDADGRTDAVVNSWSVFVTDAAGSGVWSWYPARDPRRGASGLNDLMGAFHAKWSTDADARSHLKFLISTLCTATAQVILVEPRLVMAYVGLEAFAGEVAPRGKRVNMQRDLTAALANYGVATSASFLQSPGGMEPVAHLVAVRNAIVHSNKQLSDSQWDPPAHIGHAWKVALWMLQQFLLRLLGYNGFYNNHMTFELEQLPAPTTLAHRFTPTNT